MGHRTPLYQAHVDAGAKIVDFGGWDMPLHYGSQLDEHHQVRRDCGMFDVSHMCVLDLHGAGVRPFLRRLLANDVSKLTATGRALYSCMLNEQGTVLDDLIVYYMDDEWFRMVVNAGTRDKDIAWIRRHAAAADVEVVVRDDFVMIAVQGPNARSRVAPLLPEADRPAAAALGPFRARACGDLFVATTGYTGEDGFEVMVPADRGKEFWNDLVAQGCAPCGLGARDTLRLEAGMNLYGSDMDESTTPLESSLGWTIAWDPADRAFIGRPALEKQRAAGARRKLVGLLLQDRGVLRGHMRVVTSAGDGETTSGGFSPTLGKSIALARVPVGAGDELEVEVRGKLLKATVVKPPFARNGKPLV
ncbi:MAG: glycine cleavage system aminomethyltransferase GcvT [Xanthomonadaceae bacterium]|nr:glycine cleavage system aminomethyltransferase GcvT [Xanthomonadaceae bacterium]